MSVKIPNLFINLSQQVVRIYCAPAIVDGNNQSILYKSWRDGQFQNIVLSFLLIVVEFFEVDWQ